MKDSWGRAITYLRLSVTDRCNLRCAYCMGMDPDLLPHADILSIEELARVSRCFMRLGITKLRITGGEPLVRKGILELLAQLARDRTAGRLAELTMTTNGIGLAPVAATLRACGLRRINVSLDSLDPDEFRQITGWDALGRVLDGIAAAKAAGLKVKINTVLLAGTTEQTLDDLIRWTGRSGHDLTLIEAMPLGGLAGTAGTGMPSAQQVLRGLYDRWTLLPSRQVTSGPARYYTVAETGGTLGLIAALSRCFCADCNRIRLTAAGRMSLCLGHDTGVPLRDLLRAGGDDGPVERAILAAIAGKPRGHAFLAAARPAASAVDQRGKMSRMGG